MLPLRRVILLGDDERLLSLTGIFVVTPYKNGACEEGGVEDTAKICD